MKTIIVATALSFSGCALGYKLFGNALTVEAAMLVTSPKTTYRKCAGGNRVTCVVDGDTLWIEGTKIRAADIDAPEASRNMHPSWRLEIRQPIG